MDGYDVNDGVVMQRRLYNVKTSIDNHLHVIHTYTCLHSQTEQTHSQMQTIKMHSLCKEKKTNRLRNGLF